MGHRGHLISLDTAGGLTAREALRVLRELRAHGATPAATRADDDTPLEFSALDGDPPRLQAATPIEGDRLAVRELAEPPIAGFHAFLDGVQNSRVVERWSTGMPVVHGTVAAVVRVRVERELSTWRDAPLIARALYLPVSLVADGSVDAMRAAGLDVVDTIDGAVGAPVRHPAELIALARTAVQRKRESLEIALAEQWCLEGDGPLYVDGGIAASGAAAQHEHAVGVVKSHRTLYAEGDAVDTVLALPEGARTTGFEIRSPRRTGVASWYLRLRDARGRDPFFGLVRVEIARSHFSTERADLVSRWVLAERAPVSLPDRRWSTMAYGIRSCEEYLRAVTA